MQTELTKFQDYLETPDTTEITIRRVLGWSGLLFVPIRCLVRYDSGLWFAMGDMIVKLHKRDDNNLTRSYVTVRRSSLPYGSFRELKFPSYLKNIDVRNVLHHSDLERWDFTFEALTSKFSYGIDELVARVTDVSEKLLFDIKTYETVPETVTI